MAQYFNLYLTSRVNGALRSFTLTTLVTGSDYFCFNPVNFTSSNELGSEQNQDQDLAVKVQSEQMTCFDPLITIK